MNQDLFDHTQNKRLTLARPTAAESETHKRNKTPTISQSNYSGSKMIRIVEKEAYTPSIRETAN